MKTIFALCALILVLAGFLVWRAMRAPTEFGTFTGAPPAQVVDLIDRPAEFLHRTVLVHGVIRKQCEAMGCYFFFLSGDKMLRVDISEVAMTAPQKNGHPARVEGQIVPYNDGYQFWASAVRFE